MCQPLGWSPQVSHTVQWCRAYINFCRQNKKKGKEKRKKQRIKRERERESRERESRERGSSRIRAWVLVWSYFGHLIIIHWLDSMFDSICRQFIFGVSVLCLSCGVKIKKKNFFDSHFIISCRPTRNFTSQLCIFSYRHTPGREEQESICVCVCLCVRLPVSL